MFFCDESQMRMRKRKKTKMKTRAAGKRTTIAMTATRSDTSALRILQRISDQVVQAHG